MRGIDGLYRFMNEVSSIKLSVSTLHVHKYVGITAHHLCEGLLHE